MAIRIEIITKASDTRASVRQKKLQSLLNKTLTDCHIIDIYTIAKAISQQQLEIIAARLANPVTQTFAFKTEKTKIKTPFTFTFAIEIGFLPGVPANIPTTTKEIAQDCLKVPF